MDGEHRRGMRGLSRAGKDEYRGDLKKKEYRQGKGAGIGGRGGGGRSKSRLGKGVLPPTLSREKEKGLLEGG